jgi:hypothetical protein
MPLWAKWTASVAALFFLILGTQMLFLHTPSTQLADKQMILQNITSSFHLNDVQSKKSIEKSLSTTRIKKVEPIENANKQIVKSTELISPSNETFTTPTLNDESLNVASITNNNRFPTATNAIEVTPNGITEKGKETNTNIAHEEMVFEKIEDEDEHVIYVGSLEINSDKLRGISRKFNALLKKVRTTEKEKEQ